MYGNDCLSLVYLPWINERGMWKPVVYFQAREKRIGQIIEYNKNHKAKQKSIMPLPENSSRKVIS